MNAIIYKVLFQKCNWNSNESIDSLLYKTIINEKEQMSLEKILFSSFLYEYNDKSTLLFSRNLNRIYNTKIKKTKLLIFYTKIWKNIFIDNIQKETLLLLFCKFQKIYYIFIRFIKNYKFNRANIAVNQDLFLNTLDVTHKKTCGFFIYRSIYYFNVSDIWKIVEKAWTNHDNFQLELQNPKNPYTNIEFSKVELYQYYFHLKTNTLHIPILLEFMFQDDFELAIFEIKYEMFIFKYIIRKFVFDNQTSNSRLYYDIMEMILENTYTNKWEIHRDFPKEKLVKIMRPYVYLYYLIIYGKMTENQFIHISSILYNYLYIFWKFNPKFGMERKTYPFTTISFYDSYLPIKTRHL